MIVYILLVLAILFVNFVHIKIKLGRKGNKFISSDQIKFFMWLTMLAFVSGCRGINVGTDTKGYLNIFLAHNGLSYGNTNQEILFKNLCVGMGCITDNPQWLLVATSVLICGCVLLFIRDNSQLYGLSVFYFLGLYYYFNSMNVMRQYIAMGIILLSTKYARERKLFKFIFCILLAIGFHKTAVLGVLIWFVYKPPITLRRCVSIGAIMLGAFICFPMVVKMGFLSKYVTYYDPQMGEAGGIMTPVVYTFIFVAALAVVCIDKAWIKNENNLALFLISEVAMIWAYAPLLVTGLSATSFQRIGWYFQIYSIALVPNLLTSRIFQKKRQFYYLLFIVVGFAHMVYFLSVGTTGFNGVMPYRFFWQ